MIDECVTYDSTDDLQQLLDDSVIYIGRLFSIRIMNLDGVFVPAYYTALMVKYQDSIGFMVLFDDSKRYYLNEFKFIELQYVTSYTMFTDNGMNWYERFMPYINIAVVSDFITRMEIKNGDISIAINNSIIRVMQKSFEVVLG